MDKLVKYGGLVFLMVVVSLVVATMVVKTPVVNEDNVVARVLSSIRSEILGSVTGPEDSFTDRGFNGRFERNFGSRVAIGTTTLFRVVSPAATTTGFINCSVTHASTSATILTLANSTGGFATTTNLTAEPTTAGNGVELSYEFGSTTGAALPPNQTIILSATHLIDGATETNGATAPGAIPLGHCSGTLYWY